MNFLGKVIIHKNFEKSKSKGIIKPMISKYRNRGLTWIDLTSPTEEELSYVFEEYSIPEFIRQEAIKNTSEHHISLENETVFAVLRPNKRNQDKIVFIKNRDFVLTIHDQPVSSIEDFSNELELDISYESDSKIKNHDLLLAHLFKKIYLGFYCKMLDNEEVNLILKEKLHKKNKHIKHLIALNITSFIIIIILILIIYGIYNF